MPSYPPAPMTDRIDDYHGTRIADPYRELEDADAPATQEWVDRENELTAGYLNNVPGRQTMKEQLTGLWNYERFEGLFHCRGQYFYHGNTGLQNQSVVYVMSSLTGTPRALLDPNTYRADGTAAQSGESVSWDGKLYGYGIAHEGSDWIDWRIRDVATGTDRPDLIRWSKGGISWTADNKSFYYSRFPEPPARQVLTAAALDEKVYFHKLGDPQSADRLIYEIPAHPSWTASPIVLEGGRYLALYIYAGDPGTNLLSYIDLEDPSRTVIDLVTASEITCAPLAYIGSTLYVQTNFEAPRGRIMAIDLAKPERANWKEIVAQHDETLEDVRIAGGRILVTYMKDAHSAAKLFNLDGSFIRDIEMPGLGTAYWSDAQLIHKEIFFRFASFTIPPAYYRLDLTTGKTSLVRAGKSVFQTADYETEQVFYKSRDGTRVPMFLSYRKGLKLDGQNPTILYAYGGFNAAITPNFSSGIAQWMAMGGVYACANLRGGSEYGEEWHAAGARANKQNVFDDFIAAAEFLIAGKYTSSAKLAIYGGSNGGLLVGAVLNQHPGLFGAAMPAVGVMDMLRFHKFGFGTQWVGEYGNPDDPDDFKIILAYSPLHNIKAGTQYPATLITTSDHDDRVMPGHSLKYAATLQQAQKGPAPILIRVETRAGHGAGKPTSKQIDEWIDRYAFLKLALKM